MTKKGVGAPESRTGAFACLLAGEAIGRCEYYMQLAKRTPRRELDGALARVVAGP